MGRVGADGDGEGRAQGLASPDRDAGGKRTHVVLILHPDLLEDFPGSGARHDAVEQKNTLRTS